MVAMASQITSLTTVYSSVYHIEAETKWTPFRRRYFQVHFLNENVWIPIKISLKFVPKGPINNITSLVQMMVWRRPGAKPLSEPMMVSLLTHICGTRPQWVIQAQIKKTTSKLRIIGLCVGDSPVTGEFPAQMASNVKTVLASMG